MTGNLLWLAVAARGAPPLPARSRAARRRLLPRLHRHPPLRHLARRRGRRRGAGSRASSAPSRWASGRPPIWPVRSPAGGRPVKAALLDQRVVAGVGNIYADEALFAARVHPAAPAGRLSRARVARVHDAVRRRPRGGHRGPGRLDPRLPHARRRLRLGAGALRRLRPRRRALRRCGTPLRRTVIAQRGTTYCPRCQRFYRVGVRPRGASASSPLASSARSCWKPPIGFLPITICGTV